MNGPYHPMDTLDPIDADILRLKKKLQVNKMKQQDPNWQKRRNDKERLRRQALRESDPNYAEKLNAKAREYYRKNPQIQIKATTKWNKANKARKNATNKRSYEKNKVAILAKRRNKRAVIRKDKRQIKELINA